MTRSRVLNRRRFLQDTTVAAAGALALPSVIPGSALGKNGAVAPSERLVLGAIGTVLGALTLRRSRTTA